MPVMGFEDWELWVRFFLNGCKFFYLREVGFWYRVHEGSMVRSISALEFDETRKYIFNKHDHGTSCFSDAFKELSEVAVMLKSMHNYQRNNRWKSALKLVLGRSF